jgi:5-methylcytosine-specific restriction enzyme subunit McrC
MNALWQRLMGRVLREWLPDVVVKEEHSLRELIRPDPAYDPRRQRAHVPRPDYAVYDRGRLTNFLDAKYRDIWEKGLPRDMLYQLAIYASAHPGGTAAIVYPTEHSDAQEERVRIHDPHDDSVRAMIALRPVKVAELEHLWALPPGSARLNRRAAYATWLLGAI